MSKHLQQAYLVLVCFDISAHKVAREPDSRFEFVQPQVEQSQYNGGYYGYGQGYETYGYAPVAQDPAMYYGGYAAGYGGYPQVQQQPQPQQPQQQG